MSRTYRSNDFPSARYDAWRTSPPDLYDRDSEDRDAAELVVYQEHVFWPDDEPLDWDE